MKLSVTKIFQFCYSHWLEGYDGKCKNMHGHNARLEVEISKDVSDERNVLFGINPATFNGMVVDFQDLKYYVNTQVIEKIDHTCLNESLPKEFHPPTAENICRWIWFQLTAYYKEWEDVLQRVRFYETDDSYAELKKD